MKPREVIAIFEDFEEDADDELTDSEKVKEVLKDVDDKQVWSFWKTLDGYKERDYMMFKGSVLERYLGTRKTTKYFLKQRLLLSFFANSTMAKKIQKRILRQPDSKDQIIPPMKRAFKKAHRIVEEMFEEDEDDSFGWPSVIGLSDSAVEILMDKEIGDESAQVAGVEQELQGFEDGIENPKICQCPTNVCPQPSKMYQESSEMCQQLPFTTVPRNAKPRSYTMGSCQRSKINKQLPNTTISQSMRASR